MFTKFSALIGVKQESVVEPEAIIGCQNTPYCVTPSNRNGEATYHWINGQAVFQYCDC